MGSYTCLSGIDSGVVLSLTWCGVFTDMDIMEESPPHQHLMYLFYMQLVSAVSTQLCKDVAVLGAGRRCAGSGNFLS